MHCRRDMPGHASDSYSLHHRLHRQRLSSCHTRQVDIVDTDDQGWFLPDQVLFRQGNKLLQQ